MMPIATNLRLPDFGASAAGEATGAPAGRVAGAAFGGSAGRRRGSSATGWRSCSPRPEETGPEETGPEETGPEETWADGAGPDASPSAVSASGRIARAAWSLVAAIAASLHTLSRR